MNRFISAVVGICLFAVASVGVAGIITDTVEQEIYVGNWDSHSYTHNLNDDGFTWGTAVSGELSIHISDDRDDQVCILWICGELPEAVLFVVEAFDFDTGGLTFGSSFLGDLEVNALGAVNADGLLDVTIYSLFGDFIVGNSVLTIITEEVSIPAPTALLLFAIGLLGLGAARKRID
jgi:hypothetical protein